MSRPRGTLENMRRTREQGPLADTPTERDRRTGDEDNRWSSMRNSRQARALARWICALITAAVLGTACASDDEIEAQPAADAPMFVEGGEVGAIPIHPLAEPVGERVVTGDVIAQSFGVRNVTRDQVFDWYEDNLGGWRLDEPARPIGETADSAWRARWVRGDRRLLVTVSDAPTLEPARGADDSPIVQMSMSLEPTSRPLPDDDR